MYHDIMVHQSEEAANAESQKESREESREEKTGKEKSREESTLRRKNQGREKVQTYGCSAGKILSLAFQEKEKIGIFY